MRIFVILEITSQLWRNTKSPKGHSAISSSRQDLSLCCLTIRSQTGFLSAAHCGSESVCTSPQGTSNKRAMRGHRSFQRNRSPFVMLKASLRAFGEVDKNIIARANCLASVASLKLFQHISEPGKLNDSPSSRQIAA